MKTQTRLIFGIRTSGTVSLSVTAEGQLPQQPPDLRIKTSERDIAIPCSNRTWLTTLDAGDHIAHLPAPGDSWFEAQLRFTLSAPATIVGYSGTAEKLLTWTTAAGVANDLANDPKNPWPPPLEGNADAGLLADSEWLRSTLTTMKAQIAIERSAPPPVPPASAAEPGRTR